jgi:endonuclease YncB( thermonuclease family)
LSDPPPSEQTSGVIAAYAPHRAATDPARIELKGRVVRVADGDTITVLDSGNNQHKIRLNGIDAPEKSQAFGQKSREHLASLVSGKTVFVVYKSKDRYGRVLGTVFADSVNVNLEMLRGGFAWHYKRYDSTPAFAAAELEARKERRGLWVDANPINPEDFRHRGKSSVSKSSARQEYRAGSAKANRRVAAPVTDECPDAGYWLNSNSNKRHNRNCEYYRKTRGIPCQKGDGSPCGKCGG